MSEVVELKFWHFVILVALSIYSVFQLVVLPLIQKYIYRRFQHTERILDEELDFGLPSYALANRKLWIDRLLNDPEVQKVIKEITAEDEMAANKVIENARQYTNEIVPSFNALLYFRILYWLSKIILRLLFWVKVGYHSNRNYDQISQDDCVIIVSNHRSNLDPLLLVYMTSQHAPISYSAGEWALGFPFQQLLHAFGFYVVRRNQTGGKLYRCILERYVFLATSQCVPQGLFLEGALSRDGKMQALKLGLLNYQLRAYKEASCKDIVFIPAALNYDRIPEFQTLIAHQDKGFGNKGRFYSLISFTKFMASVATYMLPRRHKPFGYTSVNFGAPISLSTWLQENSTDPNVLDSAERRDTISKLGQDLADIIKALIPVLPTNILARVFKENAKSPLSEMEIKVRGAVIIQELIQRGTTILLPKNDEDYALSQGIYILIRENIILPTGDGRFRLVEGKDKLLDYYCSVFDKEDDEYSVV
ncbi:MAG: hypothetical protein HOC23_19565 [Halieaceae bacterium]|nr:hypothetical protein [Halieaceae bacterium]